MLQWTHKCRIYRATLDQKHDLSLDSGTEDIYEADRECRLMPSEGDLIELPMRGELGFSEEPADIWFPRGLDVKAGYVIRVKKPWVRDGRLGTVEGELDSQAVAGATVLVLDKAHGFESGDEITITDGTNTQRVQIKTTSGKRLTLYGEDELDDTYAVGSTVLADTYWKILSVSTPMGTGPIIQTSATRMTKQRLP